MKRPSITLIFFLSGASGSSDLLSSIDSPAPLANHWSSLTPLPMNRTAKRFGGVAAALRDSSQGSATATPGARRAGLRVTVRVDFGMRTANLPFSSGAGLSGTPDWADSEIQACRVLR